MTLLLSLSLCRRTITLKMLVDLYPPMIMEGDLSPDSFGDEVDEVCNEINAACKGFGTDEGRLLTAMGGMTPETRCKVALRYQELFGKELKKVMRSECGNRDFGKALQYLAVAPDETDCDIIEEACKGAGTNEKLLTTVIVGRTNLEMELLKKKFFNLTDKDLGRVLDSELGGHFEQLIFNCLQASEEVYDDEFHNEEKVKEDVEAFYKMGQGKWGTDEKGLFKLICARPGLHLKAVDLAYA
uniref:Annexin n=1 Tax=Entomoneis paludosa TaxID=265537 RepID=A0A7S2YT91_9STRA